MRLPIGDILTDTMRGVDAFVERCNQCKAQIAGAGIAAIGHRPRQEAARQDGDMLLRLEHIIVSHQRLPEWGSPKPPMTPEALLVHYADDIDAKFQIMADVLREPSEEEITSARNPLRTKIYRGPTET